MIITEDLYAHKYASAIDEEQCPFFHISTSFSHFHILLPVQGEENEVLFIVPVKQDDELLQ